MKAVNKHATSKANQKENPHLLVRIPVTYAPIAMKLAWQSDSSPVIRIAQSPYAAVAQIKPIIRRFK
jgi:hypothetical protein